MMIEIVAWVALILGIVGILIHIKNEWWDLGGISGPTKNEPLDEVVVNEKGLRFVIPELPEELETGPKPEQWVNAICKVCGHVLSHHGHYFGCCDCPPQKRCNHFQSQPVKTDDEKVDNLHSANNPCHHIHSPICDQNI